MLCSKMYGVLAVSFFLVACDSSESSKSAPKSAPNVAQQPIKEACVQNAEIILDGSLAKKIDSTRSSSTDIVTRPEITKVNEDKTTIAIDGKSYPLKGIQMIDASEKDVDYFDLVNLLTWSDSDTLEKISMKYAGVEAGAKVYDVGSLGSEEQIIAVIESVFEKDTNFKSVCGVQGTKGAVIIDQSSGLVVMRARIRGQIQFKDVNKAVKSLTK